MELTTTRIIDAPIDRVWSLQLDHEHWPDHLPNFKKVVRPDGEPFDIGSSAAVTQPGLGTAVWTVVRFDEQPERRAYAWRGKARGTAYEAGHEVLEVAGGTRLTLTIAAEGRLAALMAPLVRRTVQKAIDDEAAAFERWALAAPVS